MPKTLSLFLCKRSRQSAAKATADKITIAEYISFRPLPSVLCVDKVKTHICCEATNSPWAAKERTFVYRIKYFFYCHYNKKRQKVSNKRNRVFVINIYDNACAYAHTRSTCLMRGGDIFKGIVKTAVDRGEEFPFNGVQNLVFFGQVCYNLSKGTVTVPKVYDKIFKEFYL